MCNYGKFTSENWLHKLTVLCTRCRSASRSDGPWCFGLCRVIINTRISWWTFILIIMSPIYFESLFERVSEREEKERKVLFSACRSQWFDYMRIPAATNKFATDKIIIIYVVGSFDFYSNNNGNNSNSNSMWKCQCLIYRNVRNLSFRRHNAIEQRDNGSRRDGRWGKGMEE